MRRFLLLLTFGLLWAASAGADSAKDASDALLEAATLLEASETAGDRVEALTQTIRAYEAGLASMRGEVRRLTLRKRELDARLAAEDADLTALLAMMQNATLQAGTETLLHPGSAVETLRAGTLAQSLVPTLSARAAALEDVLLALEETEQVLLGGKAQLTSGLDAVRGARAALADALRDRTELPERLATDQAAMAALVNSAETLASLADALVQGEGQASERRDWLQPVEGASGRQEVGEGWELRVEPAALVTAPDDATVRFSGEIPDRGTVVILEMDGGLLLVLAGLGTSFVHRDQIVAGGDPIGFMPEMVNGAQDNLNAGDGESSLYRDETLYIEVRRGGVPVDPANFLTLEQE